MPSRTLFSLSSWVVLLSSFSLGCSWSVSQDGAVEISDLQLSDCTVESPWRIDIDFYAYSDCNDLLQMRLQSGGRPMAGSDGVSVQVPKLTEFQQRLEAGPVTVTLPSEEVELSLYLNSTCSEFPVSLAPVSGELVVESMDIRDGGRLSLSGTFDLADPRDGSIVATAVSLEVEGRIDSSSPHTEFSICP